MRYTIHMLCVIGLGNPGTKYKNNRHNAGFMFLDYVAGLCNAPTIPVFKEDKYLLSEICSISESDRDFIFAKPQTFMNKSGEATAKILKRFKIPESRLVVVHDDLDIPLGKFRIHQGYGPRLHNGISSIESAVGTKDFLRIRIGVDNRSLRNADPDPDKDRWMPGEAYVLQDFSPEELKRLNSVFPEIVRRFNRTHINKFPVHI